MRIEIAGIGDIDKIWPLISEKLESGCRKTGYATSSADMWQMCRSGNAFLVIGYEEKIEFASIWRFETWPSGLVFRCVGLCGNNITKWFVDLYHFAKAQARIGGTERLVAEGRVGLPRLAKRLLKSKVKRLWESFEVD